MRTILSLIFGLIFIVTALAVTPTPTPLKLGGIPRGTDVETYAGWHIVNGKLIVVPVATPTATATATATSTPTSTATPSATDTPTPTPTPE